MFRKVTNLKSPNSGDYRNKALLNPQKNFHISPRQCQNTRKESQYHCDLCNHWKKRIRIFTSVLYNRSYCKSRKINFNILLNQEMATSPDFSSTSRSNPDNADPNYANNKVRPKFYATKEELKSRLSPIQYQVTQLKSTERPGTGEYNKFNKKGIYHCVVCNEELFKSETKLESSCGWPAFFDSMDKNRLKYVQDYALVGANNLLLLAKNPSLVRTEVLCGNCDAHLGHRFDDGPISKGGKRYCINSAAMKFVPSPDTKD